MYDYVSRFVEHEKTGLLALHMSLYSGTKREDPIPTNMLKTNYGICQRRQFRGTVIGLHRVRAFLSKN